jgi:large subunit ribosomal protein L21
MYAVIKTGGKQYRVSEGQLLKVEKLDVEPGQVVDFEEVLMVGEGENVKVGAPFVAGSKVTAEVVRQARDKKIHILKFRRRKHHMKQMGHRQYFTEVKIKQITG